ncbi:MAG: nucleoside hydrolase-like domain-containing protein, partial [Oceanipulchritudo sp.]
MRNGAAWKKRIGYALLSVVTAWQTLAGHDLTTADLRPRLIVETDAGGDPDDEATLERLLMFSNQFELEVIIDDRSNSQIESRSTYQTEVKNAGGDGEDLVEKYIRDYGDLHANLSLHADGYPTEAKLKAITVAGHEGTNAGRDAIIAAVDADDPRPVWYGNWGSNSGTTSNLKRALDHVQAARTQAEYEEFASRLRICSLDGNTGTRQGHIDVIKLHIETGYPDISGRWYHQFQPITQTAGGFDINRDVRNNHGTLGAHYTTQKEGDSWCIVHLQNQAVGLAVPTRVRWGGWGGRYAGLRSGVNFPNNAFYWNDQADTWAGSTNRNNTAARFADDMQHHFAARFDWGQAAVYADANHAPAAVVNGDSSGAVVRLFAVPGQQVALSAAGSSDPDGDSIAYEWIRYDEADSYSGSVSISGATTRDAIVSIPGDAGG